MNKIKKQAYSDGTTILIVEDDAGERIAAINMGASTTTAKLKTEAKKWKNKGVSATAMPSMISEEDFDPDA